jgi:Arc/MetJ-type ribon-helix-helix transcriptional regulator
MQENAGMATVVPPDIEAVVRQQVEAGLYPDVDHALREAVRLLIEHSEMQDLRNKLRAAREQVDRGEYVVWNEDTKAAIWNDVVTGLENDEDPDPDVIPSS